MKTYRKLRKDYPNGVISIFDNGGKTIDRYTVLYSPFEYNKNTIFQYLGMSMLPFHPQGFAQHGEMEHRLYKSYGENVINFTELPEDCKKLVLQDLNTEG